MSIYLPYALSVDGGYKLNDKIKMKFEDNTEITFTIKGFTEDVFFSSVDTAIVGAYLPRETYEKVKDQLGDKYKTTVVFANLKEKNKNVETGIRKLINADSAVLQIDYTKGFFSFDLSTIRSSRTMIATIVAVMMVAFAVIIALVCMLVVRFRIGNSIEDDMIKIGSLKAMGYISRQIILSVALQFSIIALAGSIIGIALSYLSTPLLSDVFAHQSGLLWVQGFDPAISCISLISILLVVVIVSFITAGRINHLSPIVALRGGITTHSFRKNYFPLHKSKGSLSVVLAFKSMFQNMKQTVMIAVILVAVSFAGTFAVVIFYNTVIDTRTFAETPGVEISNVIAMLNPAVDNTELVKKIDHLKDVRKVQYIDQTTLKINNNASIAYVMDDFSQKETNTIYKGRYPLHSNEVAISGHFATMLHKKIGDSVTLGIGDKQDDYLITGLTQGTSMGGLNVSLRMDGILRINPAFKQQSLQIYLKRGVKSKDFIKNLENLYDKSILSTMNVDKQLQQGMGLYTSVVSKVGILILVITILVVILVLYFIINSSVIRKKRELGIQKAIGYTTFQLMNQLSLGFLPPVISGVILGSVIGITQTNSIMSLAEQSMGVMKANYIITPLWIAMFGVVLVIVSYLTSLLITYRIRKISAYALVTE
ncbi:FtsX-like permease family protein [Clostridium oryzae]|uniref:FtsX-like permease family protein n=2 Tax=Clostridium oryzae TaxID=1450648 RepID=A0A1V4IFC6_9CLOT|nr:FtsX-like permease family protein [Clostridium oryzae]